MSSSYLLTTVSSVLPGYSFISSIPIQRLLNALRVADAQIIARYSVFMKGECQHQEQRIVTIKDGAPQGTYPEPFQLPDTAEEWGDEIGFVEFSFESSDGTPVFWSKRPISFYSMYSAPGKKSFVTDNTYKFGSPPVIDQIARFGTFNDSHPLVHIDRASDIGCSLVLINPYQRPVVYQVLARDGQKTKKQKVIPMTAQRLDLSTLMPDGESEWITPIQLTAQNRLITYILNHALSDHRTVSTVEHLDPFRADPTHVPATQWLRNKVGNMVRYSRRPG